MIEEALRIVDPLTKAMEGLMLRPYLCSAGVPSIGYGATYYENLVRVTLRDRKITAQRAEVLMHLQLRRDFMPKVLKLCPTIDTPERLAAIVDFTFNLGAGRLASSTLRKRILAKDWDRVPDELMKWVMAGGKVQRGLVKRRTLECFLI